MSAPRVPALAIDDELKRKLLFTLLALVIYRIGAHIAAPGVNVTALADFIQNSAAAGFFGLYDALGGGLSRATVFALGIMPYISASIIFQLAGGVAPSIGKMQKDEEGKKKIIGRLATELNIERPDEGGGTRLRMCFANG